MSNWIIVSSPDNFEATRAERFKVQGMKSRHRRKAERMSKGDGLVWYLTGEQVFSGYAQITGEYFEDHSPIWSSDKKPGEDYPWRVPIRKGIALPRSKWVDVEGIAKKMEHVAKWPVEHWHLAFQGNVHEIGTKDFALIRRAIDRAAKRAAA